MTARKYLPLAFLLFSLVGAVLLNTLSNKSGLTVAERFDESDVILVGAAVGVVGAMLIVLLARPKGKGADIYGSARWAAAKDIEGSGLFQGRGVFLGQTIDGRYLRHDGPEHYAVVAPTRSGKGAGVVIPTLLAWRESALIYDLKEENWRLTAAKRAEFSHAIYFNPNSKHSAHFNPLLEVRKGLLEVRDVQNIADMIVDPEGNGYSDHWIKTGHSLLVAAVLHLLYAGEDEDKSLAGVARFLSRAEKSLVETLHEMKDYLHLGNEDGQPARPHPVVAAAARDMLNKAENERSGVLSTAMSFLTLYRDPMIAQNVSDSDFRIQDLVDSERPISLYLVIPPSDIDRLRPLIRLIVNQICRSLTEELNPQKRKHRLLLMLDEFPALGKLEFFENALGFIAGYGLKAVLISQSINQIRKIYGTNNSILDNTHVRLFYGSNTIETAEYISKSLGQSTVPYETTSRSGRGGLLSGLNRNTSSQFASRPLLTPGEVMELPGDDAILFVGGQPPIRCKKIRYFSDGSFLGDIKDSPTIVRSPRYPFGPKVEPSEWFKSTSRVDRTAFREMSRTIDTDVDCEFA